MEIHMNLILAPAAQTDSSIAVVWEKPGNAEQMEEYQLFLNGEAAEGDDYRMKYVKDVIMR